MDHFHEITPRVWRWSKFSEEKQLYFNGTVLVMGRRSILIDPVEMPQPLIDQLTRSSFPEAILLTNKDHTRSALEVQSAFRGVPIWVHHEDRPLCSIPVNHTFSGGARLHGGVDVIHLENMKSPGECAFFWDVEPGVLLLGDALIGKPQGKLSLLPAEKVPQPRLARESLKKLLKLKFDVLVVGDGESFPTGGHRALEEFLRDG